MTDTVESADAFVTQQKQFCAEMLPWSQVAESMLGVEHEGILGHWGLESGWGSDASKTLNFGGIVLRDAAGNAVLEAYANIDMFVRAYCQVMVRDCPAIYTHAVRGDTQLLTIGEALAGTVYNTSPTYIEDVVRTAAEVKAILAGGNTTPAEPAPAEPTPAPTIDAADLQPINLPYQPQGVLGIHPCIPVLIQDEADPSRQYEGLAMIDTGSGMLLLGQQFAGWGSASPDGSVQGVTPGSSPTYPASIAIKAGSCQLRSESAQVDESYTELPLLPLSVFFGAGLHRVSFIFDPADAQAPYQFEASES